jgi:transcriptional regulator with XRE-family HTH domain
MYNYIIHRNNLIIRNKHYLALMIFKYKLIILADMNEDYIKIIKSISPLELAQVARVTRDMAQKYKSGYSMPTLIKAILIEDALGIPARAWVEHKKMKEAEQ